MEHQRQRSKGCVHMHGRATKERYCNVLGVLVLAGGLISYNHPFGVMQKIDYGLEVAGNTAGGI